MMKKISIFLLPLLLFVACENYEAENQEEIPTDLKSEQEETPVIQAKQNLSVETSVDPTTITENTWTLVSGTPPNADPKPIIYKGPVSLKGKFIETESYGDQMVTVFEVDEAEKFKLPDHLRDKFFKIHGYSSEMIPQKEVTLVIDEISVHMEGFPSMDVIEY